MEQESDIKAAFEAVEQINRHFTLERDNAPLGSSTGLRWTATFAPGIWAEADTPEEAIRLAASKVREGQRPGE